MIFTSTFRPLPFPAPASPRFQSTGRKGRVLSFHISRHSKLADTTVVVATATFAFLSSPCCSYHRRQVSNNNCQPNPLQSRGGPCRLRPPPHRRTRYKPQRTSCPANFIHNITIAAEPKRLANRASPCACIPANQYRARPERAKSLSQWHRTSICWCDVYRCILGIGE